VFQIISSIELPYEPGAIIDLLSITFQAFSLDTFNNYNAYRSARSQCIHFS